MLSPMPSFLCALTSSLKAFSEDEFTVGNFCNSARQREMTDRDAQCPLVLQMSQIQTQILIQMQIPKNYKCKSGDEEMHTSHLCAMEQSCAHA